MTSARRRRYETAMRRLDHGSPVGSVDLSAFQPDGTPYLIWPCVDCAAWHAEVITHDGGFVFVREWHSTDCPQFQAVTAHPVREPARDGR
jgi:hypothetical protein